jgi:excisionase family DNA binding protein
MDSTTQLATEAEDTTCLIGAAARSLEVSEATLRKWADLGRVPCRRIGRLRVFRRADLERIAKMRERE